MGLWERNPLAERHPWADLYKGISAHYQSLTTLQLNMSRNRMCGGNIGAVLAAILDTGASIEKLLLEFSYHNIIQPQNCCSRHYQGADPDHTLPFRWAHMARLEHLVIVMTHCYCDGVDGWPDRYSRSCSSMRRVLYRNLFRGLSDVHSLK